MSHLRFSSDDFDAYNDYVKYIQLCIEEKMHKDYHISWFQILAEDVEYEEITEPIKQIEK